MIHSRHWRLASGYIYSRLRKLEGNLLLFKPRLCIGVLSDICFTLADEERFTIVVDLMEALGNEDVPRIKAH